MPSGYPHDPLTGALDPLDAVAELIRHHNLRLLILDEAEQLDESRLPVFRTLSAKTGCSFLVWKKKFVLPSRRGLWLVWKRREQHDV